MTVDAGGRIRPEPVVLTSHRPRRRCAAGATQVTAPRAMPWGETPAFVEDPDGNPLHITATAEGSA